ncbi:MAG TPA: alpha/beta hydrolase [Micromonosporaceae bacterium]|jgi:pimeloyl-ACP methyl ester carboxylesterase|nr:alpha/beta hydrolase [Micromonosporaceae bacterium]
MADSAVAKRSGGHRSTRRRVGLVGAIVGVAAAGVAAGVAAERALVRRTRTGGDDPYANERFGQQPFDESLTVTTEDGTPLYVEIVDPADGVDLELDDLHLNLARPIGTPDPTLVFVHGFCLDMGTFHFQRDELTRRGDARMVFYDQPGHGRSGKIDQGEYTLEDLGRALRRVIDETVPDGPIVLIGHSMGGMTILAFAELYPELFRERVAGAVLVATSAGRLETTRVGLPTIVARAAQPLMPIVNGATRLTATMVDRARLASSDLAWLLTRKYGFGTARPSASLVSFVERMNSHTSTDTVARYLRTLYTHARYPALDALREIPVLVICGAQDQITPLALSQEIYRRLPDAELVVVPDSGHVVLLEHSAEVNAALVAFLEKIH